LAPSGVLVAPLERGPDVRGRLEQVGGKHVGGGPPAAVAGIDQLNDAATCDQPKRGQLHDPVGGLHLGCLEIEAVPLQGAEHLLDPPPRTVGAHGLLGLLERTDRQRRDEPPQQRFGILRGVISLASRKPSVRLLGSPVGPRAPRSFHVRPPHESL